MLVAHTPVDRWFREWGVSFASEGKMCTRAKELMQDIFAKKGLFSFPLKDEDGGGRENSSST